MDANFILFRNSYKDNFIDVVDGDHEAFAPDIINTINDDTQE